MGLNWVQIGLFMLYVAAMLMPGLTWHELLVPPGKKISRLVHLGEALLLGGMVMVAEMLLLSIVGLYRAPFLWAVVALDMACVFHPGARRGLGQVFTGRMSWTPSVVIFVLVLLIFAFRNCSLLMDIDSHSTYLLAQKLWLEHASSVFASTAVDMKIFVPMFNAVPYALSLSIFPMETFFPQMVVAFWTVIVLLLVFGYVAARKQPAYGLAACFLVLLDDHMFYSGANTSVVINSALIAFLFAGAYNFWEARRQKEPLRWVMALVFLTQVMANKYQLAYSLVPILMMGMMLAPGLVSCLKQLWKKPSCGWSLMAAILIFCLWPLKNGLATGDPFFPILADRMHVLNWAPDKVHAFNQIFVGPLGLGMVIKYFTYLLSWPWLTIARLFAFLLVVWPAVYLFSVLRKKDDSEAFAEAGYWFITAIFIVAGICMVSFVDPRPYRYGIAVMAVAVVWTLDYIFTRSFGWGRRWAVGVTLLLSLQGWPVVLHQGGPLKKPNLNTNWLVLTDKLHMQQFMYFYYINNAIILQEAPYYADKMSSSAWDTGVGGDVYLSLFLLPTRPQVGVWYTSVVKWSSYSSPALVAEDLVNAGIYYVMTVKDNHLHFESALDYAQRIVDVDRFPKTLFYDYDFPAELARVNP